MIKKHNIVDIIFPATSCSEQDILEIKNYLQNINLLPRIFFEKNTTPRTNLNCLLSNFSAKSRFEQLYEALKSPDSNLVWCGGGGYSSGDILPLLARAKKIKQNKMFIGFSDITSILVFLQQNWGWQTICAPLPMQLIKNGKMPVNKDSEQEIINLIFGKITNFKYDLFALNKITKNIEAEITGGCLSVMCGHFGSNFQIEFADKILFLEDMEESGERLDRYFRQIIEVILKTKKSPQAILLGEFCYGIKDKFLRQNIDKAIINFIARIEEFKLDIPVFKAKDGLGHSDKMRPLILGAKSKIDISKNQLAVSNLHWG
jgi:muramoyltetrapeptide carboxypeptidase